MSERVYVKDYGYGTVVRHEVNDTRVNTRETSPYPYPGTDVAQYRFGSHQPFPYRSRQEFEKDAESEGFRAS